MALEEQMRIEVRRLEKEISLLDDELERLHGKMAHILAIRKKKEHDLRILRENFGEPASDVEMQLTLEGILKERHRIRH